MAWKSRAYQGEQEMRKNEIIKTVLCCLTVLFVGSAAMAAIVDEDFSTDPSARGWVTVNDSSESPTFKWVGVTEDVPPVTVEKALGENVHRAAEEAIYVSLGQTFTQNNSFSAKFGAGTVYIGANTYQDAKFGFMNSTNLFLNGTPDTYNNVDVLGMVLSNHNYNVCAMQARVFTSSGVERNNGAWKYIDRPEDKVVGLYAEQSYQLEYSAGAGANGAGQLVLTRYILGDYTTVVNTQVVDLQVGDTFAVDSFGMFAGHGTYNSSDGFHVGLDDVVITPEPATMGLLVMGGVCALLRKKH